MPFPVADYGEDQLWARSAIDSGYSKVYSKLAAVYHSHDYDVQQTFDRAVIEARFYLSKFGWRLITRDFDELLSHCNSHDEKWGKEHGVEASQIEVQKRLNAAKLHGYLVGMDQAERELRHKTG